MVQTGRGIQYKFDIHRKYTVIRGDSASGKTTLVRLIDDASVRKTASLSCDVPCVVLPELHWELNLSAISRTIVFIDEDHPALAEGEKLASLMKQSDNCFVIISREKMPWIPYSYREIYEIKSSGKYHILKRIYEKQEDFKENNRYVTEDEGAGYQYFQKWYGKRVITSHGNSSLSKYAEKGTTLIGDGAAIGPYMYDLLLGKADLYLPESFEWMLLHSPVFEKNAEVGKVLEAPESVISTDYQSWEEFFTEYLTKITAGKPYRYSKSAINPCYTEYCCFKGSYCEGFTSGNKSPGRT